MQAGWTWEQLTTNLKWPPSHQCAFGRPQLRIPRATSRGAGQARVRVTKSVLYHYNTALEQRLAGNAELCFAELRSAIARTDAANGRDIDYAAKAVKTAIVEKYLREQRQDLETIAGDRPISIVTTGVLQRVQGMTCLRLSARQQTADLWEVLAREGRCVS